jgi:hypothetical protein
LEELRLLESYIPIIRDIGSGFEHLTILWISRCSICELDGIASFSNLKELYLSYNEIHELEDLSRLDHLEILDLEEFCFLTRNFITDLEQVENLSLCAALRDVTLKGNPLQIHELEYVIDEDQKEILARKIVLKILKQVKVLDDILVDTAMETTIYKPGTSYGRRSESPVANMERPSSSYGRSVDSSSTLTIGMIY